MINDNGKCHHFVHMWIASVQFIDHNLFLKKLDLVKLVMLQIDFLSWNIASPLYH